MGLIISEKTEAVIFDFNGVLFWDDRYHEAAWIEYAEKNHDINFEDPRNKEILEYLQERGKSYKTVLEYLFKRNITPEELSKGMREKEDLYKEQYMNDETELCLSPGAVELFERLNYQEIPITIATAADVDNLEFFFQRFELYKWFDFDMVVYDDGIIPSKPAPDIYLKAARNLKVPIDKTIVVEDSRSGIEAANSAGAGQIFALGPIEKHSRLKEYLGVTNTIVDLSEINFN